MRDDTYSRLGFAVAASLAIGASSGGCDPVVSGDDPPTDGPVSQRHSRSLQSSMFRGTCCIAWKGIRGVYGRALLKKL